MNISATILAAGSSTRMGNTNKLLLLYKGKSLINITCDTLINSKLEPILVITGFDHKKITNSLPKAIDSVIYNDNWSEGISTSINLAISSLPDIIDGNMIVLSDMPLIKVKTINKLREAFVKHNGEKIIYADYLGRQANPVIFPKKHFNDISILKGDTGCKKIINQNKINSLGIAIDSSEVVFDCDTEEDYSNLIKK
ncbi:MAG: nucleotidyltransferase family protein [Candidatus Neomarinimicrobiota bacterium]